MYKNAEYYFKSIIKMYKNVKLRIFRIQILTFLKLNYRDDSLKIFHLVLEIVVPQIRQIRYFYHTKIVFRRA